MTLPAGARLGRYAIRALLGAGGMGEVYLAHDATLERKVALKILPPALVADAERAARFVREAKAASALNHPHILTIYEIGEAQPEDTLPPDAPGDGARNSAQQAQNSAVHYIAMEFVEGVTLRDIIHHERADLSKSLKYLTQVADALAKAHAAGIVHRDLKPDNIMVTRDGYAKLLDFGLAKLVEPAAALAAGDLAEAETAVMAEHSKPGAVMGTVGYMSPEQARGQTVDQRSDIFSFGCILYEAATGKRAFAGDSAVDTLHKIIYEQAVPVRDLNPLAPVELQRITRKCLAKDVEERYQTIKDAAIDLKELRREMASESSERSVAPPLASAESSAMAHGAATTRTSGASGPPSSARETREARTQTAEEYDSASRAQANDGGLAARAGRRNKSSALILAALLAVVVAGLIFGWYKLSDQEQSAPAAAPLRITPLTTSPGVERSPAFSPDGRQIAFVWTGAANDNFDIYVKIVDAGVPLRLTTDPARDMSPVWSPDGRYVAFLRGSGAGKGFYLVPALGGPERRLTGAFGWSALGVIVQALDWSPDGRTLAIVDKEAEDEPWSIFLVSVETGERRRLTTPPAQYDGDFHVAFSPDGRSLAFARNHDWQVNDIHLVPVAGGDPVRLTTDEAQISSLAWTRDGERLVFSSARMGNPTLWTISAARAGSAPTPIAGIGENAIDVSVARQGDRLAYAQLSSDADIWRIELTNRAGGQQSGAEPERFISSTRLEARPQISPDGQRIAFQSNRSGAFEIWVCASDGQNPVQLTNFGGPATGNARWSPDGRFIAFDSRAGGNADIYIISVEGGNPRRLTTDPAEEVQPAWSRDGNWIYFASRRTGRREVWKMPAAGGEATQVTRGGGYAPFESPDGRFIYYAKGLGDPTLWQVSVESGEETQALEAPIEWSRWVVGERGIYYIARQSPVPASTTIFTLEFFDLATSRTSRLATLEGARGGFLLTGLAVSPDERWILFTQRDTLGVDLMLVENFR